MSSSPQRWVDVRTHHVEAVDTRFAVRELGADSAVPLVLLTHLGADLDSWDPAVVDALASEHRVVAVGYRGVGSSDGTARASIDAMAADVAAVVRATGHRRVDVFGLSMGGMVAQALVARVPDLVDRLVLASTGPRGGAGLTSMTGVFLRSTGRATLARQDPRRRLFFTPSAAGRSAATEYLARLDQRSTDRDRPVTPAVVFRQLRAVSRWGHEPVPTAPLWQRPTLLVHGEDDRMVPVANAAMLQRLLPDSALRTFPDAGHGVVSQHHTAVTDAVLAFLAR